MITEITGPLWTLVITGRSYGSESWGFWPGGEFVPWRVYISADGAEEYAAAKDYEDGRPATWPLPQFTKDGRRWS